MTTNDAESSRPSLVCSNPSSIRFNRVLGNIGAPLRVGLLGFEEGEAEEVILDEADAELQEVRRNNEEMRTGMASSEAIDDTAHECVAGPSRSPAVRA